MKTLIFSFFFLLSSSSIFSQGCNLFFSEYLEGTSNNKAIEIYNPTSVAVDLSNYKIYRYNNGSPTPTDSLSPKGMLAANSAYVAGNPSAIAAILNVSDTLHTITFFNGDDAMELRYIPTNLSLDVIGIIGNDPGTNWVVGTGATSEFTLVRKFANNNGELSWSINNTEWDVNPANTTSFLGTHTAASCCVNTSSTFSTVACDNYTWLQTGVNYTISGTYLDTIPNAAGCDSIITLNLTINTLPVVSVNSATMCLGQTIVLFPNGLTSYTISPGNSNYVSPLADANYTVTGTDANGCPGSAVSSVTVHALPNIMAMTDNTLICVGASANLSAMGSAISYTWDTGSNTTSISVSPTITTTYTLMGTDANGCSNTTTVQQDVSVCTDIKHISFNNLNVYPNPTEGIINIKSGLNDGSVKIEVINTLGDIVFTSSPLNNNKMMSFNISHLSNGIYFIKIIENDKVAKVQKVVKN